MRPGGGKSKGSAFEREIARILSLWWSKGERDDVFARTMSSGAWGTQRAKAGKKTFGQHGDLQAIDPIGQPFISACCIELKIGYGKWCILDAFDRARGTNPQTFESFLIQAQCSAEKTGAMPMLIFKRDRKEVMVVYPLPLHHKIVETSGEPDKSVGGIRLHLEKGEYPWIIIRLDEFIDWASPDSFGSKPILKDGSYSFLKPKKPMLKPKLKLKLKNA